MIKYQNPIFLICPDDSNESIKIKPNIFGQEDSDNVIFFDASCTILIANKNYLNIIDVLHILEKESIDSCTFLSINCSIRTHDNTYARNLSKLGLLFHKIGCQTKVVGFYYHYIIALSELRLSATNTPEFDQSKFNKRYLIVIDRRCFECLVTDIKDIPIYNLFLITVLFYGASLVELDSSQGFIQSCMDFSRMHPKKIICLMGNRKTDHALNSLQSFQQTDEGWPRFLRVFPIINFDYADVWKYIQKFSVPYCKLYSQGYTSIGSLNKTRKNETLRINGSDKCLHASELTDVSSERNFR
ncbi:hypothetical protein MXB_1931 [Myxobolus squamalis]|nr:hypothetical protein MXB_1931 [Myxobolus squamalis]